MNANPITTSCLIWLLALLPQVLAQPAGPPRQLPLPEGVILHRDLAYVPDGHPRQKLDLYLPKGGTNLPRIINIHGGAFRIGSKEQGVPLEYLAQGYAAREFLAMRLKPASQPEANEAFEQNRRLGRGVNILGYDPIWNRREQARFQARYFQMLKKAGFDSVRINLYPFRHMDAGAGWAVRQSWWETRHG
jgi:hypothetical protein